tara:strand:- start:158 stop:394 length:237 start_codon:yes stop_codon:yes gene_type:complete
MWMWKAAIIAKNNIATTNISKPLAILAASEFGVVTALRSVASLVVNFILLILSLFTNYFQKKSLALNQAAKDSLRIKL